MSDIEQSVKPIPPLQARFVEEYIVDLNASAAAERAGYSPKSAYAQGHRLLKNAQVAKAIAAAFARRTARVEVTQDYVLANLTEVVERCMQRAPVMVREGRNVAQAVDEDGAHVWQFDSRGAVASLGLLGKHLAMFTDKVDHTSGGKPIRFTLKIGERGAAEG